ncbi:hypothetical protein Tco_1286784 [Tanacetum coccineum]
MAAAAMEHMASNFAKLDKFKRVDFRRWQKKMHFLLSSMSVVGLILNGMSDPLFDIYQNVKSFKELWDSLDGKYMTEDESKIFQAHLKYQKEELTLVELGSHRRIEESLKVQNNDKAKGNNVVGPIVINIVDHNNSSRIEKVKKLAIKLMVQAQMDDDVAWWVDSGENVHVRKDRCWFKTYESLNDVSILHIGNESTALVHGRNYVDLRFSSRKIISLFNVLHVPNIRKNLVSSSNLSGYKQVSESNKFVLFKHAFMSTSKLNDSILWHARLGYVHYKRLQEMSKTELRVLRFYVIEPNESVSIKLIIESRDAIFDENRFSSVLKPSFKIPNGTEDIGGLVVGCRKTNSIYL